LCGDRDEASEVLQDTMLKVLRGVCDYRGSGPFWGWLRQIAINEALLRLRRGRRLEHVLPLDGHDAEDAAPPPPAAADAALLQRALAALPAATRSVLWLYHAEGHTHEEIAALMQRSPSFSKSQLARGPRRLRVLLQVQEQYEQDPFPATDLGRRLRRAAAGVAASRGMAADRTTARAEAPPRAARTAVGDRRIHRRAGGIA